MKYDEYKISCQIGQYLTTWNKNILFQFTNDAIKLTAAQAGRKKALRQKKGYPDLFIPEPRNGYHGLYIELKKDKFEVYGKKGKLRNNEHLKEQIERMQELEERGYYTSFCWSLTMFLKIWEAYEKGIKLDISNFK